MGSCQSSVLVAKERVITLIRAITTNPIFARMTRRGIPLRATLWICVGAVLFTMVFGVTVGLMSDTLASIAMPVVILIFAVPSFLLNALPPVVAGFAAIVVGNDVQSEDYAMLILTPITPQQIVRGYVSATLYRQRALHAVAAGLSFMGLFYWLGALFQKILSTQSSIESLEIIQVVVAIANPVLTILRFTSLVILASSVGVMLSLLWRRRGLAGVVAAIVMILLQATEALVASVAYWFIFTNQDSDMVKEYVSIFQLGDGILFAILVYLLAWGTMRLAQRWVYTE